MAVVKEVKQRETLKKKVQEVVGVKWERKADVKQNKSKCQNDMYKD